jgi:hypothetical protein
MPGENGDTWENFTNAVMAESDKVRALVPQTKEAKKEQELPNLNAVLRESRYYVRGSSLNALIRSRIPIDWRVGSGTSLSIALGVFASAVAELILKQVILPSSDENGKTQPLAPRHIAQALYNTAGLSHLFKDSIIIGTPLSHLPNQAHVIKRARKYKAKGPRGFVAGLEDWGQTRMDDD